jgi:hypothetical protein
MRTVKISDAVWAAIAERGKFGETEDDVLRREFDLPSGNDAERTQMSSGRRGRGNTRYATKRMSARTEGSQLVVEFEDGATNRWELPHPSKKEDVKRLREEAVAFALEHGATDPGQTNAVRKALTNSGFHIAGKEPRTSRTRS